MSLTSPCWRTASQTDTCLYGGQYPARARADEPVWANDVVPDVATNQMGAQEGRLVILLMDRSIPYQGALVAAQKIAIAAVEALGPNDLGALVSTSGVYTAQNFTADRRRLVQAIMQRDWSTESLWFPWSLDEGGDGRCLCGLCVLEMVTRVSEAVREAPRRRKMLLFIGRGLVVNSAPRGPTADPGCERLLDAARQKLYDSLAMSNLTVHSIDPRGLENVGDHTQAAVSGAGFDRPVHSGQAVRRQQLTAALNATLRTQDSLRILPERTGGRTVVNTNAPDGQVPRSSAESRGVYLVGFERDPASQADSRRSIEVKVARKGVRAYSRKASTIAAPSAASPGTSRMSNGAPATLDGAITGLLPHAGTPSRAEHVRLREARGRGCRRQHQRRRWCLRRGCAGAAGHHRGRRRSDRPTRLAPPGRHQPWVSDLAGPRAPQWTCRRISSSIPATTRSAWPSPTRRPERQGASSRTSRFQSSPRRLSRIRHCSRGRTSRGFTGRGWCARVDPSDHTTPIRSRRSGSRVS